MSHEYLIGTMHPKVPSIHLDRLAFIAQFGTEAELLAKVRERLRQAIGERKA
ncbi:hypothetical protein [Rhodanobacter caeni]|uniref:Uncharacterized protein n=1 Tax=Rhodanobacter caeni TaxID=657654 RepID=A0ABP3EDV5_9GAMM